MPIYEYECSTCGHRFEKRVKVGAEAPPCPECAGADVRKRISSSGFILKGGGWYKDHYGLKSGGSKDAGSSSSESGGSSGAAEAPKAAEKPAPKADTSAAAAK
jgi:putative FmdB family regulatory protein